MLKEASDSDKFQGDASSVMLGNMESAEALAEGADGSGSTAAVALPNPKEERSPLKADSRVASRERVHAIALASADKMGVAQAKSHQRAPMAARTPTARATMVAADQ